MNTKLQQNIFEAGESDAWHLRNSALLDEKRADVFASWVEFFGLKPERVLDIGCANGYVLDALTRKFHAKGWGVELSAEAVKEGQHKYPHLNLQCGPACKLDHIEDASIDLVFINGVFCWIDRTLLFTTCAQIDRVLVDGGFLLIGDFHPELPLKNRYHHLQTAEVWTYKQNHAEVFLASGLYHLVHRLSFDHASLEKPAPIVATTDRWSLQLLRKSCDSWLDQSKL